MLKAVFTSRFKKDVRLAKKRGKDTAELLKLIELVLSEEKLPPDYVDHPLKGDWIGHRDAHIEGDWLLIYRVDAEVGEAVFVRTGTHSDLF